MSSPQFPFRRITSPRNASLTESWCPGCGIFIAAAEDVRNLQAAEDSHKCNGVQTSSIPAQSERPSTQLPKTG